jgi:hypothetical protein
MEGRNEHRQPLLLGFTLLTDSQMYELYNYFLKLYNTNNNQGPDLCYVVKFIYNVKVLSMKKTIVISFVLIGIVFLTSMIINLSSAQSSLPSPKDSAVSKPIPTSVMKIAERSCVKCHTEGGNGMAMMHLNLSNWDKYSPEKQADKAKDICKMVSKGKMPPKGFSEKNPGADPIKDETKIICDWATSIQIVKK